jgi:hypothetical protein
VTRAAGSKLPRSTELYTTPGQALRGRWRCPEGGGGAEEEEERGADAGTWRYSKTCLVCGGAGGYHSECVGLLLHSRVPKPGEKGRLTVKQRHSNRGAAPAPCEAWAI